MDNVKGSFKEQRKHAIKRCASSNQGMHHLESKFDTLWLNIKFALGPYPKLQMLWLGYMFFLMQNVEPQVIVTYIGSKVSFFTFNMV